MIEYNLKIETSCYLRKPSDFLDAVKLHCLMLPQYMPMKWGWTEPRTPFDPNHIEQLVYENGNVDTVFWKCSGKNRARGSWFIRGFGWQGCVGITVYKTRFQEQLLAYLKTSSVRFEVFISCLDSCAEQYKEIGMANDYAPTASSIYLRSLRHWLPDMPWAVVFGPAYVQMFGKEKLLSCPAYKVEELGPEMVFIQLTPNMDDIHQHYEVVMQARSIAKQHLGEECFFKPELAYDYRLSVLNPLSEEEIEAKRGKVFRVPNFVLKEDE